MHISYLLIATTPLWSTLVHAHLAAWSKGMYCLNGPTGKEDLNAYNIINPLYQLAKKDWWFHHVDRCDEFPPPAGEFLELPAGKDFTVEISANRATTTLAYGGKYISDWPDGQTYPDNYNIPSCITTPNMHTQNQSMASGTAFAISYQSDISNVTPENLIVFSVRYHTPWKRVTTYSVPAAMPSCPPGGCICAWGWVPNGCGQPNMYHQPFKCTVTGATSHTPLASPKPPVWCEDDPSRCTRGAKQMIYWNQNEGNNIAVTGQDKAGMPKSPAYNAKCGFADGAQNDIFGDAVSGAGSVPPASNTPKPTSSKPLTLIASSPTLSSTPVPSAPASTSSRPTPPASSIPAPPGTSVPSVPASSAASPTHSASSIPVSANPTAPAYPSNHPSSSHPTTQKGPSGPAHTASAGHGQGSHGQGQCGQRSSRSSRSPPPSPPAPNPVLANRAPLVRRHRHYGRNGSKAAW